MKYLNFQSKLHGLLLGEKSTDEIKFEEPLETMDLFEYYNWMIYNHIISEKEKEVEAQNQ